jgi:hypothetical protein
MSVPYHNVGERDISGDGEAVGGEGEAHWQLEVGHHVASPDRGSI